MFMLSFSLLVVVVYISNWFCNAYIQGDQKIVSHYRIINECIMNRIIAFRWDQIFFVNLRCQISTTILPLWYWIFCAWP